jgi:peptidyl-prolyl cis-trans isomerase A (cyclophilin A)
MRIVIVIALASCSAVALADTTAGAGDPIAGHNITIEDALKGVKGTGTLTAKLDVEQAGKSLGSFTCELFEKQAPKTVANFVGLARGLRPWKDPKTSEWQKKPMYDGTVFHRVIPEFMIQGGDPKGNGTGDPGYEFGDEFAEGLQMDKGGILAMANRGPGTNGSQFFITEKATPWLTGKHTIFGQCTPLDLEMKIARLPAGARNMPNDPVTLKKVTISRGAPKKAAGGAKKEKAEKPAEKAAGAE